MCRVTRRVPLPQNLPNEQGCGCQAKQPKPGHHSSERKHRQGPDSAGCPRPEERAAKPAPATPREAFTCKHAQAETSGYDDRGGERDFQRWRHWGTRHSDEHGDEPNREGDDSADQRTQHPKADTQHRRVTLTPLSSAQRQASAAAAHDRASRRRVQRVVGHPVEIGRRSSRYLGLRRRAKVDDIRGFRPRDADIQKPIVIEVADRKPVDGAFAVADIHRREVPI